MLQSELQRRAGRELATHLPTLAPRKVGTVGIIPSNGQTESGKTVICEAGGRIEQLLQGALLVPRTSEARDMQAWEESVLAVARMDVIRALSVAEDREVTRAELTVALFFLAQSARAAVRVAEHLRGAGE